MREVHIPTPAGRFARCTQCKSEPRHVQHHGRTTRETMVRGVPALRHSLECPCGRSTGRHAALASAEADWGQRFGQLALALVPSIPQSGRRRDAGKEHARG